MSVDSAAFRFVSTSRRVREDRRFVAGHGNYVADIVPEGTLHVAVLPSQHPSARILSIDSSAALAMPGVHYVLTGEELASAIDEFFGSFDKFVGHFSAAANSLQGSGWAVLAWDPVGAQLLVHQLYDQQNNTPLGVTPILQLDMWEHAFYLDYVNVKADYVKAWWNIVNWADAAARFERARSQTSGLIVPAV